MSGAVADLGRWVVAFSTRRLAHIVIGTFPTRMKGTPCMRQETAINLVMNDRDKSQMPHLGPADTGDDAGECMASCKACWREGPPCVCSEEGFWRENRTGAWNGLKSDLWDPRGSWSHIVHSDCNQHNVHSDRAGGRAEGPAMLLKTNTHPYHHSLGGDQSEPFILSRFKP